MHNRIKILQLLYYATLFCNLNIMLIACLNYICYIYYFFKTLIKYNGLLIHSSLPDLLIPRTHTFSTDSGFTHLCLLHSFQGLKPLTLFIIETYTLAHRYVWTGPYDAPLFLTSIFFSYKQHFATFYVSLYDIYTINTIKQ